MTPIAADWAVQRPCNVLGALILRGSAGRREQTRDMLYVEYVSCRPTGGAPIAEASSVPRNCTGAYNSSKVRTSKEVQFTTSAHITTHKTLV